MHRPTAPDDRTRGHPWRRGSRGGHRLHTINLDSGAITTLGTIGSLPGEVIDITAIR
ncbi:hypothetical protein [Elioraea sp.]|uniref:hypothetical protein n=1 Tax=Elioraea sp. TaxID=2185103 RepID=UPI0025C0BD48|nr:hypothetical protein [Elioraea sp.]